jgi:hypothetical protein
MFKRDWSIYSKKMITILGFIVNIIGVEWGGGNLYIHLLSTSIFTLIMNKKFIWVPKSNEESGYHLHLEVLNLLILIECFIFLGKVV